MTSHSHSAHHHHPGEACGAHPTPRSHLFFFIAACLNTLLTLVQLAYAYSAHSTSLLADAGHNFSDVLALLLSWLAFYLAQKKTSSAYSYGYKKSTVLATLVNAVTLVVVSTLILVAALHHLFIPTTVAPLPVMMVAMVGILINGGSALLFLKQSKTDLNIKSAYLHLMLDALLSLSVVITGFLIYLTHWNLLDPIVALIITSLILKSSLKLLKQTIDLSLDGVPQSIDFKAVEDYLIQLPGVSALHDLHIWALSTTENALTVHLIRQAGSFSAEERKALSQHLATHFHIDHTTIQIEEHLTKDCLHEQNC